MLVYLQHPPPLFPTGSFRGVLAEFAFQDYLVALYPAIQPDDLAKLRHRVDSQRALYARGFWFAAFFGIVLFCGGETYLACNFRSVYDDLRLELVESVAGSSTGQVAPQGTLDAVNLFLTLEAFPAVSILTLVAIGLWRMNSQGVPSCWSGRCRLSVWERVVVRACPLATAPFFFFSPTTNYFLARSDRQQVARHGPGSKGRQA